MPNPKPKTYAERTIDIRSLARAHTKHCIEVLGGYAANPRVADNIRIQAIAILLERGWGKPPQAITGEDGEGDIKLTIRHLIEDQRGQVIDGTVERIDIKPLVITGDR